MALASDQMSSESLRAMPCSSTSSLRVARSSSSALVPPNLQRVCTRESSDFVDLPVVPDSNLLMVFMLAAA